jgi:heme oxygenase
MALANEKQQVHELVERLAPSQISALVHLLEVMVDPVAHSLANAPVDDELLTDEEIREIAAARDSLDRGEGIPNEEVLSEFGLSPDDFARMGRTGM